MQNTRLNQLINGTTERVELWLQNPWRRWAWIIINFLFGIYLASAISLVAGQRAQLDVVMAAIIVVVSEILIKFTYGVRRNTVNPPYLIEFLNALRIGVSYGFVMEAFKLGS